MLIQNGKVITYASRQLKVHEMNYLNNDIELDAVVFSFKKWTLIYHKILQYVFNHKELNLRQRRSIELLKDYGMSILYH